MTAKFRVTVNLEERQYAGLSTLSKEYGLSRSWLARRAITLFLQTRLEPEEDEIESEEDEEEIIKAGLLSETRSVDG